MRSETTILKDNIEQTQARIKTSGGETVKVIINEHHNPRIDAVGALQCWMEFIKTTFQNDHAWLDIEGRRSANLQKILEELTAILRENGIPDTFTVFSTRHAAITH
ncbi:uncharacterized protein MONOS_14369 [Monocercomonoides exilis]|uniref:uncharacterized protein n=1 Tax=Monocercomonoides exilis TaxID=2049356 RepID=UPI0035598F52|nr:hypothetical protein MONOS_14369 [Monocercomonoides exilis]|eukprot:MONOS_14369.1-p1 / transcript=MONOS_14369.1 / gene=MONOS_14369 / organism=Monocercomonoides_exilis_PA203 / gene_product=unspecified product / transcript_product=unspecified product / location=Mono_scaffold00990:17233-17550(-) / protein_length=106 / sequence_SO=supercontig / SO=protein_coding / is_pseudo=false